MSTPISVNILGKEYQVACPDEEKNALIESAKLLHNNMEKIRSGGKIVGLERIAVMAALNLAHDLISLQNQEDPSSKEIDKSVVSMQEKIGGFLEEVRQLNL